MVSGAGNHVEGEIVQQIIDDFNASQSDWVVALESFPQESYNDSVTVAALAGNLPDIIDVDGPILPNWAWAGYMAPLTIDESKLDGFLPGSLGRWNGELYAVGLWDAACAIFARKSVLEAAKILQLEDLLERKPKALSGGQRQRVAIGRAITRNPKVFLFDEPLSNLDASLRSQMRVELTELHSQIKATMIYVTHDQVEAMTMADQIVVLSKGNIEQVGNPMELYEFPQTLFVARFIGSPKMNIFQGEVAAKYQCQTLEV